MQQVVNLRHLSLTERVHARGGMFRFYPLVQGTDGSPGNFYMQLSKTYADFESPRHRHNFDQIRLQLEGDADFARDGLMTPGVVAYFPEGVHYGPQTVAGESYTLVLQFGGASRSGYLSDAEFQAGIAELKEVGSFEGGIYKVRRADGSQRSKDAYEAVWEHVHGKDLVYPANRYQKPVFMQPEAFDWRDEQPGIRRRALGTFSEAGTTLSMLSLDAGASMDIPANTVLFVVAGRGWSDAVEWEKHSTMYSGEAPSRIAADGACELFEVRLPQL